MEFRWVCTVILHGTFVLFLTSVSVGMEDFESLKCTNASDCILSAHDCALVRCDCADTVGCSSSACNNLQCPLYKVLDGAPCCGIIPAPFNTSEHLNIIHIESFWISGSQTDKVMKLMTWSQVVNNPNAEWKLTRTTLINSRSDTPPTTVAIADSGVTDLDSILETPMNNTSLLTGLEFMKADKNLCNEPLNCSDDVNIVCECGQCLYRSLSSQQICELNPSGSSFQGYTVLGMGDYIANNLVEDYDVTTSSSLSLIHNYSNSIDEWVEGTFGGWAPVTGSMDHWVKYNNLDTSIMICGVVIQGVAADKMRSLDEFKVTTDNGIISYNETDPMDIKLFKSGVVLNSRSIHYFKAPVVTNMLNIIVQQPTDASRVGFRSGLITCTVGIVYCSTLEECFQQELTKEFEKIKEDLPEDASTEETAQFVTNLVETLLANTTIEPNTSITVEVEGVVINIVGETSEDLQAEGVTITSTAIVTTNDTDAEPKVSTVVLTPESFKGFPENQTITLVLVVSELEEDENENTEAKVGGDEAEDTFYLSSSVMVLSAYAEDGTYIGLSYVVFNVTTKTFDKVDDKSVNGSYKCMYFHEQEKVPGVPANWKGEGCTLESRGKNHVASCVCDHSTSYAVLFRVVEANHTGAWEEALSIITYVGCGISAVALLAALAIYFLLRSSISAARYVIHSNLMVSILLSILIFVSLLDMKSSEILCDIVKYALHYLYTVSFCWMLCEGVHLYRQIVTVFETVKHAWIYYVIGWALPLVSVITAVVCIKLIPAIHDDRKVCWHSPGSIGSWLFLGPIILIMLFNVGVLLRVTIIVVRAAKLQAEKNTSEKVCQAKAGIRSSLLLMPLLGVTFALGFFLWLGPIAELIFNIVNSLQGFFIALFYCLLNNEVRNAIAQRIKRSKDASTIQGSTTGLKTDSGKSKSMFSKENKVSPATQFTFTEPTATD